MTAPTSASIDAAKVIAALLMLGGIHSSGGLPKIQAEHGAAPPVLH
ncbi:hypothetical protein ACWZJV_15315 [Nocardioides sp. WG-D5]